MARLWMFSESSLSYEWVISEWSLDDIGVISQSYLALGDLSVISGSGWSLSHIWLLVISESYSHTFIHNIHWPARISFNISFKFNTFVMTSFVIISTDYLLSRWHFLTVRSSVKSTLSWRASGTLMRTSTKNIGSVSHSHLISTQIRVIRTVWSQIDQMLIFRASFLHSTSMPRPSTLTHLTTRSWIGRITCSCGGKNIFLSQITQLRFGWCLKKYSQGVVFSQTSLPNRSSIGKRP